MANDIRKADETQRDFKDKSVKSACYAPFVSLFFTTTGNVLACCRNETHILGNVRDQRLVEIWNGGKITALRRALTDYKFNLGCAYCEWEIKGGNKQTAYRSLFDPFPVLSTQPEWPAVIDFVGSNTCNFECAMCWGELSSSIRANRQGLPPLPKAYGDQFFEDLRPFLPHLRWMNFLGGEPFLTSEAHRIWDMLIEDGLSLPCHVTTNGSLYNAKVERILNAIPMNFTVSLDGSTKETFEKIRRKSNFDTVIANLRRFHTYTQGRGTSFHIAFCLMRQNWHEFGDVLLMGEDLDCDVLVNTVIDPSYCSLFTLPPHELRAVLQQMEKQGGSIAGRLGRNRGSWEESLEKLRSATETAQIAKLESVLNSHLRRDDPLVMAKRLAREGDYQKALEGLQQIRPGDTDYYFALDLSGYIRGLMGDLAGARADLDRALQISRKLPDAYLNLARILFKQGAVRSALENAMRAKELVLPEDLVEAQVLGLLAVIYARQWRMADAWRALARLIALPVTSREGEVLPDSPAGVRRSVEEIQGKPVSLRTRLLAARVRILLRCVRAGHKLREKTRVFGLATRKKGIHASTPATTALQNGVKNSGVGGERKRAWSLRVAGANQAHLVFPEGSPESVRVAIEHCEGGTPHDLQLNHSMLKFRSNRVYRIKFEARADHPRTISVGLAKADSPWTNLGFYRTLEVTTAWREIDEEFVCPADECNGRLHFDLGESGISFEVASFTMNEAVN